jgi:hypothetical protein
MFVGNSLLSMLLPDPEIESGGVWSQLICLIFGSISYDMQDLTHWVPEFPQIS